MPQKTTLPTAIEFLKTLEVANENCIAVCAVRGPASKIIPVGIRAQMLALKRLTTYWAANRAAYNALLEASAPAVPAKPAATAKSKAQRAGA